MSFQTKVHGETGGNVWTVDAGGLIDVADEHGLKIAGVEITAVNAGAALLENVVGGTVTASKAVVVDANKALDTLCIASLKLGAGAGTSITPTAAKINNLVQGVSADKKINGGTHTVSADEDTANTVTFAAGITVVSAVAQVVRAGAVVTGDAAVSFATTNLTVANGSTYVLTANDVINWIAFGT